MPFVEIFQTQMTLFVGQCQEGRFGLSLKVQIRPGAYIQDFNLGWGRESTDHYGKCLERGLSLGRKKKTVLPSQPTKGSEGAPRGVRGSETNFSPFHASHQDASR